MSLIICLFPAWTLLSSYEFLSSPVSLRPPCLCIICPLCQDWASPILAIASLLYAIWPSLVAWEPISKLELGVGYGRRVSVSGTLQGAISIVGKRRIKGCHNVTSEWSTGRGDIVVTFPIFFPLMPRTPAIMWQPWPPPSLVAEAGSGELWLRPLCECLLMNTAFFWGWWDVLRSIVIVVAQPCEYTKKP